MKQKILIIAIIGFIYSFTTIKKNNIQFSQNIQFSDYDEFTGWTRVLLKDSKKWGFIDKDSNIVIPFIFKKLSPFDSEGMSLGQLGNKYGFINTKCDTIIQFIYDDLSVFNVGLARAEINGKNGYINRKGNTIIPFKYDKAHGFIDCGIAQVSENNKWGFINSEGKIIMPLIYSDVDYHSKDSILFASKNGMWAIFNHYGKQKSNFIYDEIYGTSNNFDYFNPNYLFKGLLLVRKDNQYCYLNRNFKTVVKFGYYSKAEPLTEYGFAIVERGNYGIINSKGDEVVPCNYSKIEHPKKKYQGNYSEFYIYQNGKVGLLNNEAKQITDISYTSFNRQNINENGINHIFFIAEKNNKYGLIRDNGEIILPIEYDEIKEFESNFCAIVKKDGLFGLINIKGEIQLPLEYSNILTSYFDLNYLVVKKGKYGVINKKTLELIIPINYDYLEVCFYDKTHFIVKENGKYGIIDMKLNIIISLEYDSISNWIEYGPKEHFIVKDGKEGLISRDGKIVIPPIYDKIYVNNEELIKVKKNGNYGTVNWKNEIIHPIQFEQILWEWPHLTGRPIDTIYVKKSGKYFATDTNGKVILESVSEKIINDKFGYILNKNDIIIDE